MSDTVKRTKSNSAAGAAQPPFSFSSLPDDGDNDTFDNEDPMTLYHTLCSTDTTYT